MPVKKEREYRNIAQPFSARLDQKRIESDFYVEGYATTFDKPYLMYEYDGNKYYERIEKTALDGVDLSDVILQYDHAGRVFARSSNNTLIVENDGNGLFICADLSKTQMSKSLYEDISQKMITKMSWGFSVAEDSYNAETRTRTTKKIKKVYDVSAVSLPANNDTNINARSYFDGLIEVEKQELLEQQKQKLRIKTLL